MKFITSIREKATENVEVGKEKVTKGLKKWATAKHKITTKTKRKKTYDRSYGSNMFKSRVFLNQKKPLNDIMDSDDGII